MNGASPMTRTERTYYVVSGGYNLAQFFIAPVYPLFLLSRGLDLFQINVVLAVYLVTVLLFEIPTGAAADRFGRKASFLAACAVRAGAYALYASAETFADCLTAEVIDAIGTTLASGALEAWAVDGVHADGQRRPTDRMFARAQVIARGLMIAGGVACGHLAQLNLVWPWLVAAALFVATGLWGAVAMREARGLEGDGSGVGRRSFGRAAADAVAAVRGTPVLLLLCLVTLAGAFAGFPIHMLWQARVESLSGEGPWLMGWILALLNLGALGGSALLPRLLDRLGRAAVLAGATLWRAALLGVAAAATTLSPTVGGLVLQEIAAGLSDPVLIAWTNEHIAPAERATVLSVRSVFFTLGGAAGLVTLGLVARGGGIPLAWALAAAVFALTAPAFVLLGRVAGRAEPAPAAPVALAPTKVGPGGELSV
jgi:MFS family permease